MNRTAIILCLLLVLRDSFGFSVETWNVGEISDPNPDRIQRLLNAGFSGYKPDVVLLQEVGHITMVQLEKSRALTQGYREFRGKLAGGLPRGGLITFVKNDRLPQGDFYEDFPSEMGRGLLVVEASVCGMKVHVANVHLESPDLLFWQSHKYRIQQVQRINEITSASDNWILSGDFNPVFERNADSWFVDAWKDAWLDKYPDDLGFTWDPDHNAMAWQQGGFLLPGFRLDRTLYKSALLNAMDSVRVGVNSTPPLSDHYGLITVFECLK